VRRGRTAIIALALVGAACSGGTKGIASGGATTTAPTTTAPPATTKATTTTVTAPTTTTPLPPPAQPRTAQDPATLATDLVADERAIRDPATAADDVTRAARRAQLAYRLLGRHPEWDPIVLPLIPAELSAAVTWNIDARRRFVAMADGLPIHDTLPQWRIAAPRPADELLGYYHEAEQRYGVGWSYLAAINLVETGIGRIVGLSSAGAQGPMQFMPSTWEAYGGGGDIDSPHDSIVGAARYRAAHGFADGDIDGALWHYNHSDDYVAAVKDYAAVMAAEPATFAAYHAWDVYYFTVAGDVVLPIGYEEHERIPVADYLATHPQ
jgi:membrane-bound lytic murein transglycosylase B